MRNTNDKQSIDTNLNVTYIKKWNISITIASILLISGGIAIIIIADTQLFPNYLIFMGILIIILGILINTIRLKNK